MGDIMNKKIIVCPNEEKLKLLESFSNESSLSNIKFMNKNEFFNYYFYSYDEAALYYLMNKYNFHIDVCKVYLKYMYVVDIEKEYKNSKLLFLRDLKKELIDNNLFTFNKAFSKILDDSQILVKNYYDLEKYEEEILNYSNEWKSSKVNKDIFEYQTMEEEINGIALKIISLLNKGVDINKIYLTNFSNEYLYMLEKIFSFYKIPININYNNSIYGTKVVQDYLNNGTLELEDNSKREINQKLVNILKSLNKIDSESIEYKTLLIDKLKSTNLSISKLDKAINIKNLYNEEFNEDEYVFLLGFNSNFPNLDKDINYLNDNDIEEVDLYSTDYKNKRSKIILSNILNSIDNLFISYSLSSPFTSFYKSPLIEEYGLNIVVDSNDNYKCSNKYNKIRLGEMLDNYYVYGEDSKDLEVLNSNYDIPYNVYSNKFTGINNDTYLKNLAYPLNLSYTSLNCYNECKFKYYVKYVLKLDTYEDTFPAFVGSMYHEILSICTRENFDFNIAYNEYLEKRELSLKEKILLIRIKDDLLFLLDKLKEQRLITGYNEEIYEKKFVVPLKSDILVNLVGYIDKIMCYRKVEDTYFSIIDYKTGTIDTHIEPMKYGLHMQLPVYLYLIHYSKDFTSPLFTGIYYQNILFDYPKWSSKMDNEVGDRYLLQGYSTPEVDRLERFDSTYEDSKLIKSMKYKDDKFGAYTKTIDDDTLYDLVKYTKNIIDTNTDDIIKGDFSINPKNYNKKNVSCEYCQFRDLCYMNDNDIIMLDKVDDLTFLGGDD